MIRTLKEDFWLREWEFINKAKKDIEGIIQKYNKDYPHSAIGYKTPFEFDLVSRNLEFQQKLG